MKTKLITEKRFSCLFNWKIKRAEKKGWRVKSIVVTPFFMTAEMHKKEED